MTIYPLKNYVPTVKDKRELLKDWPSHKVKLYLNNYSKLIKKKKNNN